MSRNCWIKKWTIAQQTKASLTLIYYYSKNVTSVHCKIKLFKNIIMSIKYNILWERKLEWNKIYKYVIFKNRITSYIRYCYTLKSCTQRQLVHTSSMIVIFLHTGLVWKRKNRICKNDDVMNDLSLWLVYIFQ